MAVTGRSVSNIFPAESRSSFCSASICFTTLSTADGEEAS